MAVFALRRAMPKRKTVAGGMGAGLVFALCCGGLPVFASVGLGAGWRYVPQLVVLGTAAIVALNWGYYRPCS